MTFLKPFALACLSLLITSAVSASTFTLRYTGTEYDMADYRVGAQTPINYTLRGAYAPPMHVWGDFRFTGVLPTNARLTFNGTGRVSAYARGTGAALSANLTLDTISFGDGINTFGTDAFLTAEIVTDALGSVVDWDVFLQNGAPVDVDRLSVSATTGDRVSYSREYLFSCPPGTFCSLGSVGIGSEEAFANANVGGIWQVVSVPPQVSLPAGVVLMLTGLGAFAGIKRRKRQVSWKKS